MSWSQDVRAGAWIGHRLAPFGNGRVSSVVPGGFAAYARVLHPAGVFDGGPGTRWTDVAAWAGTELTPQTNWTDVALPPTRPAASLPWDGYGPEQGRLHEHVVTALAGMLAAHTSTPDGCWFGVWEGWGDLTSDGTVPVDLPRLQLPQRAYLLYSGPVTAALDMPDAPPHTPNLWWPEDRAWCVASEIDLDRTYVGGSAGLVAALLSQPVAEVQRVDPDDDQVTQHVPLWLRGTLEQILDRLLSDGTAGIDLSRGAITAHLRRPTVLGQGELAVTSVNDHGGRTGSKHPITRHDLAKLDVLARSALRWAVADLVT